MAGYKIEIYLKVFKQIEKINKNERKVIGEKISSLKSNPHPAQSTKLVNEELYRLRVGNFRVLYVIDDSNKVVNIIGVKHRSEAYKNL
jgi:mRNA interferase RelE/StbE